jgi:hypothetical protein
MAPAALIYQLTSLLIKVPSLFDLPALQLLPIYINDAGEVCDPTTQHRLRLAPGAHLHLLLHHPDQLLPPPEPFEPKQHQVVPVDGTLVFQLNQTPWGKAEVTVQFPAGLWMRQDQENTLPLCPDEVACLITDVRALSQSHKSVPGFSPVEAISVNNAYTEASKRYEPSRKSNTADIYKCMRTRSGRLLRKEWAYLEQQAR